ncbi:MAG TPA: metallophosphoesterase, partial [Chthoniobacteraceae bacterium]|nr:metallophosphoesterase [Chthoniobacteraceae bacterium]
MSHPTTLTALLRFAVAGTLLLIAVANIAPLRADTTLIPAGAIWKYLDNGSDQGTAWRGTTFSDSTWASGAAELGYGDGSEGRPEATVVGFGPNASTKYITTYFRHTFNVANAAEFATLRLRVIRDDGVVVYLNGQEIWRNSMPGTFNYQTVATTAIAGADEYTFVEAIVPSTALVTGQNVLAAEIHQSAASSTDISFNLELIGRPAGLTRQPYLQIGTPTSVMVRWRTDVATDTVVRFGRSPSELTSTVTADQGNPKTEHEVTLTGLAPDTRYYYSVGSTSATFASGESQVFYTAPPAGSAHPTRIWVLGDAGTGTANQLAVRNAYYNLTQGAYTDVLLMLGDNVYETGTDNEYTTRHFGVYQDILRQTVSWPTIGNHDTAGSTSPSGTIPYYQSFSLPTAGQAGGVPSGTEDYYSFDHGDIHFICLDSMTENRSVNGPMATWLEQDLAATTQKWIIAYWHHPPYSKGHDSDTDTVETQMRSNIVPILEEYGVDLVLSGHSHGYERSYLLDGHYGTSSTLNSSMIKDGSNGRGEGGYNKPTANGAGREGAVYAVAGSSGKTQDYPGINDNGTGNGTGHPAMFISWERMGTMIIDVDGHRMDVTFLRETGVIADTFTITRGPRTNSPPSVAINSPANGGEFNRGQSITIDATAADGDQGISEVVFYANASRIATLPASGNGSAYAYTWTPPANGNYRFEVRAVDQLGNSTVSAPIDVVVSTGVPVPDTTPPAGITNLVATAGLNDAGLSFRSPGDDGADTGAAASYDIRYSTDDPA